MTFEQLSIFVAVAEREHLTRAAAAIGLTPSAVSAAIRNLEAYYRVALFHRVGRRIELTAEGRLFLDEARATLARARAAELMLSELGGLSRGRIGIHASQTVASYWLPPVLMRFHANYPGIELALTIGNTRSVAQAVSQGEADVGFIEGVINDPALAVAKVADDALLVVTAADHPFADGRPLSPRQLIEESGWVMREEGSGTRSTFEETLRRLGEDPARLRTVLTLPSNEAVLSAVVAGRCAAVVSGMAAAGRLHDGDVVAANFALPARQFSILRHKERRPSQAASMLEKMSREVLPGKNEP
ncbi:MULTISPECIES: LysR family transcriptional regulator [Alphaproteobacteria]|uniref:LysR family transcriptional regulator n=2 Tax=Alphaproteobacteria TaxID=28211 RepID=A0A512HI52_9HYPH|nr:MULTISPECIES: LysR family transcriptional regulator [Alphaproteobacteria]GEO85128.1 LysR family transcriptional regulator [Ciceribacter naphthalenivorans]GLR24538.1 LysR family transcriptional regulator [Ciceribacter naphthalenivorans]GLT07394.1 LysR family transcriptional regulator [Sphingomonas psychrolutea]